MMNAMGIPPNKGPGKHYRLPAGQRRARPVPEHHAGQRDVSPINMANGYATIANGGRFHEPYIIDKVESKDGEVLYDHSVSDKQVIDADAGLGHRRRRELRPAAGRPVRHRHAALGIDRPAAGKTGTATNALDQVDSAWFTGYTPQLSTSVMYVRGKGNEQLDGWLPSYFGGDYPADTWTAIMKRDMEGVEVEDFPPPANVDGEAPDDGHQPTLPPQPTKKPTPSDTPSNTGRPTKTPTAVPTPTQPTQAPTTEAPPPPPPTTPTDIPTPTSSCDVLGCPTPTASATATATRAAATQGASRATVLWAWWNRMRW